jgi:hypothetical protein
MPGADGGEMYKKGIEFTPDLDKWLVIKQQDQTRNDQDT